MTTPSQAMPAVDVHLLDVFDQCLMELETTTAMHLRLHALREPIRKLLDRADKADQFRREAELCGLLKSALSGMGREDVIAFAERIHAKMSTGSDTPSEGV